MANFTDRMTGAARLDVQTYELEADTGATGQAMGVVLLSSIAGGIGSVGLGTGGVIMGSVAALIGWVAWAFLTYFIGTRLLAEPQTRADADAGVCPITRPGTHRRDRARRGSPRLRHRLDLDVGGHGDCCTSGPGLHEHLAGGRRVSGGVGGVGRNQLSFSSDLLWASSLWLKGNRPGRSDVRHSRHGDGSTQESHTDAGIVDCCQ